jgi:hypothetical protein
MKTKLPEGWKCCQEADDEAYLLKIWNHYDTNEYLEMDLAPDGGDDLFLQLYRNLKRSKTKTRLPENWKPCRESNYHFIVKHFNIDYVNNSTKIYNWPIRCVRLYKPNYPLN